MNGYSDTQNGSVRDAQKIAYKEADFRVPPMEMPQAEYDQEWLSAFDAAMRSQGFEYTGDHCMCDDAERGHEPACGWSSLKEALVILGGGK